MSTERKILEKVQAIHDEALDIYAADEFSITDDPAFPYGKHPEHVMSAIRIMHICDSILGISHE